MRINQNVDNGNVAAKKCKEVLHRNNADGNQSWHALSDVNESQPTIENDNTRFRSNYNSNYELRENVEIVDNRKVKKSAYTQRSSENNVEETVCNNQYQLNIQSHNINTTNNKSTRNLEEEDGVSKDRENFIYADSPVQIDEEKILEHSDTDEMSENGTKPVPRGIVNPNYPGFQHLAHTLQDYSSNIENFYHSENDMTDDDLDTEIIDIEPNRNESPIEIKENNNNNSINTSKDIQSKNSSKDICCLNNSLESRTQNEIPDLLKTISNNNNNIDSNTYDCCSQTDIENNFHTKDIIGDFNKEIEDEIKQLLNYNINIQDDLEELRKDIKDTFTQPIESTINNISDVVNHVIKKLVETQSEGCDEIDDVADNNNVQDDVKENVDMNAENETNSRKEMNLSRPTFLLIENNVNSKITDAILSDGKDEINIYENDYDTEALSHNVENTIKQLSTELRKIIPKLNEMRERDKLWTENKQPSVTDSNSNRISTSPTTSCCSLVTTATIENQSACGRQNKSGINAIFNKKLTQIEPKDRQTSVAHNSQSNPSVRKYDNIKEYEFDSFDVYNIETALPKLDLDAIENHLKAAKEAERRKRNDREEIRKRLAMGAESEEYYSLGHTDRPGKKPSLHSRLQNGKNLQICFMNETASDNESQASDVERSLTGSNKSLSRSSIYSKSSYNHPYQTRPLSVNITKLEKMSTVQSGAKLRPSSLSLKQSSKSRSTHSLSHIELKESDFYALQATLQTEARIALAQAKEMARIQMERERRSRAVSPVTEMLRRSLDKARAPLAPDRRRVSRQLLTDMNIAQLQVIVNELHSQIEWLNDSLVKLLMARDELHMGQDSMLVDIEDLTRYLGVKEQTKKTKGTTTKSGVRRLTSLVHK
ncbi:uncharacterized protein Schip1 [Epargyreus clarus]|uniref:uncharacterized protein Schip1 n=1 Tax=Epargyreus clarus TaxID=520877 RepID=UPI003C2EF11D